MADENQELEQELETGTESTEQPQSKEPEYSDVEKEAMAQGWVPEDQYEGTGRWRNAEDFLDRGKLFHKIDEQSRRLKATQETLESLKKHHKKVAEVEYRRALNALKAEKKEALDVGDTSRVVEIDEEIAAVKQDTAKAIQEFDAAPPQESAPNPAFMVWVNRNQWYQNDRAMKIYADSIGDELAMKGMRNPNEILLEVERRVKKEFAHKFNNPNRSRAGTVEGGGSKGSSKAEAFQLSPEETRAMNQFVRAGVMTKDEYIKEIKASRGED